MNSVVTVSAACLIEIGSSIFFTTATHHQEDLVTLQPIIDLETFKFHDLNLAKLPTIESGKGGELEEIRNHLVELQHRKLLFDGEEAFATYRKSRCGLHLDQQSQALEEWC